MTAETSTREVGRTSVDQMTPTGARIAVASSGLGHIHRGIETWAADLGHALHRSGEQVTLFQGAGEPAEPWRINLNCLRRTDPRALALVQRWGPLYGYHWGFSSGYQLEQQSMAFRLWPMIRRDFDLLHVQDPWLALLLDRLHRAGLSRPRVILAHGTEEPPAFLRRLGVLQHLAPAYLDDWKSQQPARQQVFAIPNFVDTECFRPGDRPAARERWGLPQHGLIVLCVAAIKRGHKRVDYLVSEFADWLSRRPERAAPALLVIAGGREDETDEVIEHGTRMLGDRVRFIEGVSREAMPSLYQAADFFALASLTEMMPIAVLEALASGLPVACSATPTLNWMVGPAGTPRALSERGGLTIQFEELADEAERARRGEAARRHALECFSETAVLGQIRSMYRRVLRERVAK